MIPRSFDDIAKTDIDELLVNRVPEGRTLEYKQELPGPSDKDTKEFLADVSAFANASGGDLVFGVTESEGVPVAIAGLSVQDIDSVKLRLENLIRSSLQPRLPSMWIKSIEGFDLGPVVLLRIQRTWASPHAVTHGGSFRFYMRHSAGKHPMDVTELRSAFAQSEDLPLRLRRFRDDRVAQIARGEASVATMMASWAVLHIMPLSAFLRLQTIDIRAAQALSLPPMQSDTGYHNRFNLDGLLAKRDPDGNFPGDYIQLFRTGVIEAVTAVGFALDGTKPQSINSHYESAIVRRLPGYLTVLKQLEVAPPFLACLTLFGVKGQAIQTKEYSPRSRFRIDRDVVVLPDVWIEDYSEKPHEFMKPIFDTVWQSAGQPGSANYDEHGEWHPLC